MAGSSTQTQKTDSGVDPATKAYIEQYRNRAQNQPQYQQGLDGVNKYFDPYQGAVIGQIQAEGNRQAQMANNYAGDQATRAGAYGGSREAVLRANLIGDVNRQTGQNVAQYADQGYQNAVNQYMQDKQFGAQNGLAQLNAMTPGFQPTSQYGNTTLTQHTPLLPQIIGGLATVGGAFLGRSQSQPQGGGGSGFAPLSQSTPFMNSNPGTLNFGNYGGGQSFGGAGGWNPQVIRRNPWG